MVREFSPRLPRTPRRPSSGEGFLGAPLQSRQPLESLSLWEHGDAGGALHTPQQPPGGPTHGPRSPLPHGSGDCPTLLASTRYLIPSSFLNSSNTALFCLG